jgi:hypothetical protein
MRYTKKPEKIKTGEKASIKSAAQTGIQKLGHKTRL